MPYNNTARTARLVEKILKDQPNTRYSDKELLMEVWSYMGLVLTSEQKRAFRNLPSSETITRIRRKFQEAGKYLPTEEITKERHDKAEQMKQEMLNW